MSADVLRPCPGSPNCVCSEAGEPESSSIEPFRIPPAVDPKSAFEALVHLVDDRAASSEREDTALHAVFKTRLLRFRDDFDARLDVEARVIHVRSASRLGRSDFGTNRRRVETLRGLLQETYVPPVKSGR